jgi:DNA-binding response OmpR family regulator
MQIMLVEDDSFLSNELARGLNELGLDTFAVDQGRSALDSFTFADLVLLDIALPDIDGFELCRQIRAVSSVPIIILSGRSDEFDRVLGLKLGADDYIVKPYRLRELAARIEAVSRRAGQPRDPRDARSARAAGAAPSLVWEIGRLRVDRYERQVAVDGTAVPLTPKEFGLLVLLTSQPGRLFTREEIMTEVWGHDGAGDTRTLGVHVVSLRRKLGIPGMIETRRGVGFRLVA